MAEERTQRRLAAILTADVVGYSRLMEIDEAGTLATLKERRKGILQPLVAQHHGRIVKVMGDGVFVEFASAVNAVACAIELQKAMEKANDGCPQDRRIELRIGINLGDVVVEGGDLYGDGVIIAARLQAMAEPRDICISASVHEQVEKKLPIAFDDLGPCELKNISRPVQVFRVKTEAQESERPPRPSPATQEKPSVAILPFTNMSGDPEQQYFSDGITEGIITELSRFRELFVIARNSSFQYSDKAADVKRIARELGVRFIVEGSIRRAAERLRITAQLVDASTGNHLWADRFDCDLSAIFSIQDEIVQAIVAKTAGQLRVAEEDRVRRRPTANLAAYDCFLRGLSHFRTVGPLDTGQARVWFEKAVALDPSYAAPLARLALITVHEGAFQNLPGALGRALLMADRAASLDPTDGWCHCMLGYVHLSRKSFSTAAQHFDAAMRRNPNEPDFMAFRALHDSFNGKPDIAIALMDRAERLNPSPPKWYLAIRGFALYGLRSYAEAARMFEQLVSPAYWELYFLAACYAQQGKSVEAGRSVEKTLEQKPGLTVSAVARGEIYAEAADLEHLLDGLRKAGLPE